MKFKKVAIVSHPLDRWGGAEYMLRVTAKAFHNPTIYTAWYDPDFVTEYFPFHEIKTSFMQKIPAKKRLFGELVPLLPSAYQSLDLSGHDLVIVISDGFEKMVKLPADSNVVLSVLTPPRFLWLDTRSSASKGRITYKIYKALLKDKLHGMWKKWDLAATGNYKNITAISEEVRKRVAQVYCVDSTLIYPPVNLKGLKFNRNNDSREDWYLYFGRIVSYKGVELAIKAAIEGGFKLKVAGTGADLEKMKQLVARANARHLVGFLGFVSEKQKRELLYKCKALIYPVRDEDFGIVPVEANGSGAPVIAYRGGGVVETVIDGETGVFFDQFEAESLIEAVKNFEKMSFNPEKARINASQYSEDAYTNKVKHFINGIS